MKDLELNVLFYVLFEKLPALYKIRLIQDELCQLLSAPNQQWHIDHIHYTNCVPKTTNRK